jgi:hypothetical protein
LHQGPYQPKNFVRAGRFRFRFRSIAPSATMHDEMSQTLEAFVKKWAAAGAAERANKDSFLNELCDMLEVPRPNPTADDAEANTYVFERDAKLIHEDGLATIGRIDLYKEGCFILEAKQAAHEEARRAGKTKRESPAWNVLMRDAYGQALGYARSFDRPPPFIIACDLGYCFDLYATFDGRGDYRPFPSAQQNRLFLKDLGANLELLRKVFTDPLDLDPSKHAAKVTREVAERLAELARQLEADKHDPVLIATFLMRCIFTMFAEDIGLLPTGIFTHALKEQWVPNPAAFPAAIEQLWRTMNDGGHLFGVVGKILQFNGGLFASPQALKLNKKALTLLLQAAECDWSGVEPAIFGTLLERALDPKERHALGAHYTPRAYVERLVRPTIEDPLRADWDVVQALARRNVKAAERASTDKAAKDKLKEAVAAVRAFHQKLCETRVLDPACGSGNFLYVTLDLFKRLEGEVLALLESLGEKQTVMHMESVRVTPAQFHGIEIKRWAKEIAELVLWIGYLQWHFRMYGKNLPVPEPVLKDYKNIECRDAVLAYDGEPELVRDAQGKPVTRWDGETMKVNPVTGENVPDESARVPVYKYKNPRKAEWPEADFIVGNPPYVGNKQIRLALGDGYVDAIRMAHPDVPETADLVMYWWNLAAIAVRNGRARRFGLITTKSISQTFNRQVIAEHLSAAPPLSLVFAIPNHPWVDTTDGADVRVAMTVVEAGLIPGVLATVTDERPGEDQVVVDLQVRHGHLNADMSTGADVREGVVPLRANENLCLQGCKLVGAGFLLTEEERTALAAKKIPTSMMPLYISGSDLTKRQPKRFVIDLFGLNHEEASRQFPAAMQIVLDRVKPERDLNRRDTRRRNWWLFGENAPKLRRACQGLRRFIATSEVAKHRVFVFLPLPGTLADGSLAAIAHDDAFVLGVLSSRLHVIWALASGGRMGVGDDPRYQNGPCLQPFPFPVCASPIVQHIRKTAESIDEHRRSQQAAHPDLTITGMYNVLEKLRSGEVLTAKDKVIHEQGLVSVLKKLHDDLDAAVFDAYGWPHDLTDEQILERLVALNAERAAEEKRGLIRWLRPEFQNPQGAKPAKPATQEKFAATEAFDDAEAAAGAPTGTTAVAVAWPKKLSEQIAAIRDLVVRTHGNQVAWTIESVCAAFKGAKKTDVEEVLESLEALGLVTGYTHKSTRRWKSATG